MCIGIKTSKWLDSIITYKSQGYLVDYRRATMFIVTKEIDSENISKLCRTCLREDGDKMVCLFVGPAGSSLAAKLRSLSCLEVWQGDGLPEKMCDRCVTRAESALLYREQCRAADRALRQAALKVSGLTSYAAVSGCKLYQQNQGFVPLQNSHKTLKCIECGALFTSYQELCAHSRLHLPFIQENVPPVQHMHIVESQNPYLNFNFSHLSSNLASDGAQNSQLSPSIRSNTMQTIAINGENSIRAACALHCSLCNRTFTDRTQLMSHNIAHSTENLDMSCENENIDICENSNQIPQNLSYERSINSVDNSIQNLSYQRSTTNDNNEIQNLSFPVNINLEEVPNGRPQRLQNAAIHSDNDILDARGLRFTKDLERSDSRETIDGYQLCPPNLNYKGQIEEESPEHLKSHKQDTDDPRSDENKNLECVNCKKRFRLLKSLRAHERLHTGKDLVQCEICDKRFSQSYNLKIHLRTHKTTRSHKCEYCNKCFVQKGNLVEHLRIHTKVKPFECKTCGKRFSQSSHLKNHNASHVSLRQHQCRLCGKRFKLANHLKRHLTLHTGAKAYKCHQCNQLFSQAFSLTRHLKRHESHVE
ncbi:uncharacterized protein LOC143145426 isoform X2 [Ptiloglossa arizonensis]|uniref:uncharacterized protein LOC143145426 isoform X2 n=1 Tax=Ptiloglossa arizonensis TaxID=3350558 RepID=UPI003FA08821